MDCGRDSPVGCGGSQKNGFGKTSIGLTRLKSSEIKHFSEKFNGGFDMKLDGKTQLVRDTKGNIPSAEEFIKSLKESLEYCESADDRGSIDFEMSRWQDWVRSWDDILDEGGGI